MDKATHKNMPEMCLLEMTPTRQANALSETLSHLLVLHFVSSCFLQPHVAMGRTSRVFDSLMIHWDYGCVLLGLWV